MDVWAYIEQEGGTARLSTLGGMFGATRPQIAAMGLRITAPGNDGQRDVCMPGLGALSPATPAARRAAIRATARAARAAESSGSDADAAEHAVRRGRRMARSWRQEGAHWRAADADGVDVPILDESDE